MIPIWQSFTKHSPCCEACCVRLLACRSPSEHSRLSLPPVAQNCGNHDFTSYPQPSQISPRALLFFLRRARISARSFLLNRRLPMTMPLVTRESKSETFTKVIYVILADAMNTWVGHTGLIVTEVCTALKESSTMVCCPDSRCSRSLCIYVRR